MADDTPKTVTVFLLPGLHGHGGLFAGLESALSETCLVQRVDLPQKGSQRYDKLAEWLANKLDECADKNTKRILVAESFSGPLALRIAGMRPDLISGVVLAASFCDAPVYPGIALLPLRPLFMVNPPKKALQHFLMGDDASKESIEELSAAIETVPSKTLARRVRTVLELEETDNPPLNGMPMLFLQAQYDNLVPWEAQQRLENLYPHADSHWIESPHLILQRHPSACAAHILTFIEELTQVEK